MTAFWAMTLNTIRMTTRRLAALVTVTFILLGSLFLYSFIEGDNTLVGLLRVLITWSFSFISGLLMLLVLYFSSTVLDAEMVGRQIYLLDVKPVPRWKILAGKWAGLAIVSGCLLLVMGALTYGTLRWLAHAPPASAAGPDPEGVESVEGGAATAEPDLARSEIFVSRKSWRPRLTHEDRLVEEMAEKLKNAGRIDAATLESPSLRSSLRALLAQRLPPIARGESLEFTFSGLPPPRAGDPDLHIRYKLYGRRGREPEIELRHRWELGPGGTPAAVERNLTSTAGRSQEFQASSTAIGPDGTLHLSLTNLTGDPEDDPAAELLVPNVDGIELLVPSGSFEINFFRALVLLWVRLGMLAALGIAANTFLSGRVTAFFLLGLILTGSLNSFVHSLVAPDEFELAVLEQDHSGHDHSGHDHSGHQHPGAHPQDEGDAATEWLIEVWKKTVLPALFGVLPDFEETDPAPDLLVGREIGWGRVGKQALYDIGLRAGLVWLLGLYCFYRREVGLPVTD